MVATLDESLGLLEIDGRGKMHVTPMGVKVMSMGVKVMLSMMSLNMLASAAYLAVYFYL